MIELAPALEACVKRTTLCHPLLGERPYTTNFNALYNRIYAHKLVLLKQAQASGDWAAAIQLYDRRFRPLAVQTLAEQMDDASYWRQVAKVWIDADDVFAERVRWTQIWSSRRPCRDQVMTATEHNRLRQIKDPTTIYRGCTNATANGLSWSFSEKVGAGQPVLVTAEIAKQHIQAYFTQRQPGRPDEVVAFPRHCKIIDVKERRLAS